MNLCTVKWAQCDKPETNPENCKNCSSRLSVLMTVHNSVYVLLIRVSALKLDGRFVEIPMLENNKVD